MVTRQQCPTYGDWSGTRRSMSYGQIPSAEEFLAAFQEECPGGLYPIRNTPYGELNGDHSGETLYMLVMHMWDECETEGDEEAGSWASSILETLGFEWI